VSEITPIILCASERTGTNLLRAMMSTHSDVASPPPCSLIDVLPRQSNTYFPLMGEPHIKELVDDAVLLTQSHLNAWDIDIAPDKVIDRMRNKSFWTMFQAMNEIYAENIGASHWFSKEPGLFRHMYEIALHMPNAKFIYMVRDGRDVAASMLKKKLHETHVFNAAKHWAQDQKFCLLALSDELIKERTLFVKYEDIIASPEKMMKDIMAFVDLDFQDSQLLFYKNNEVIAHANKSEFWKNTAKPIDSSNSGGYKKMLSSKEIEIFESVAGREMRELGYQLDSTGSKNIRLVERIIFQVVAKLRKHFNKGMSKEEITKHIKRNEVVSKISSRSFDD